MKTVYSLVLIFFSLSGFVFSGWSEIVINELMYHPLTNDHDEEYVELYNTGSQDVNLHRYAFSEGITFTFTEPYTLPANGYVVVAKNAEKIKEMYGIENVVGNFLGRLSNSGETLIFEDHLGRVLDRMSYLDEEPWPESPDGDGPSLELIDPNQGRNQPQNWRASAEPSSGFYWGSPGRANGRVVSNQPPKIVDVRHFPESPSFGDGVFLRAEVVDETGVMEVWAEYQAVRICSSEDDHPMPVEENKWHRIDLFDDGSHGDRIPFDNTYENELPEFPAGTLIRYKIYAHDFLSERSVAPTQYEFPRKHGIYIQEPQPESQVPKYVISLDKSAFEELERNSHFSVDEENFNNRVRGTFISADGIVYEDVQMRFLGTRSERLSPKKGWKLFFNNNYAFKENDELNLDALLHGNHPSRRGDAGLYETIAWYIYHHAGVAPVRTDVIQLSVNGENQGVYLEREDVEEDFLERIGRDSDANLYYSQGTPYIRGDERILASTEEYKKVYENQTNSSADYRDLILFIEKLNTLEGEDLKSFFMNEVDVNRLVSYLAAGTLCVDVDHVWHNHYLYHRLTDGRWEIFPERLDRTFENTQAGLYMDLSPLGSQDGVWPLARQFFSNLEFQLRYEQRIRELLSQVYEPSRLYPVIDRFVERYKEAARKDRERWKNVMPGYRSLQEQADSLKQFIKERREKLIAQLPWDVIVTQVENDPVTPTSVDSTEFRIRVLSAVPIQQVVLNTYVEGDSAIQTTKMQPTENAGEYKASFSPLQPDDVVHYFFTIHKLQSTNRYPRSPMEEFVMHVKDDVEDFYSNVVINEIMYHSPVDENEWIELYNSNDFALDVGGWVVKDKEETHQFVLPENTTIEANGYLVLAHDTSLLAYYYQHTEALGNLPFHFSNSGDQVRVFDPGGNLVDFLEFDDSSPWPSEADGDGPSLELIRPDYDNSSPSSWKSSEGDFLWGTPGRRNSVSPESTRIKSWELY